VIPGDTVTLASGSRGPLAIRNCNGTAAAPIIIRNDSRGTGPTTVQRSSGSGGGFIFTCDSCVHVAIDGSFKWVGGPSGTTYGMKFTMTGGGAPTAFIKVAGLSRFVTIRNVEIDGTWPRLANDGIGISVNDHSILARDYPGMWREGFLIENNYVHDVEGEGMYIGPNYIDGGLPLRNIEIRNNRVEDTGWDGINTKSMWTGDNSIHHNVIKRVGKNTLTTSNASQYSGISNGEGTVTIYNNWIEKTGERGITQYTNNGPLESEGKGPFDTYIWNNVIVDVGFYWQTYMNASRGISIGACGGCEKPMVYVFNNTIVNSRLEGIYAAQNVGGGYVRNNIVTGAGATPISLPANVSQTNNRVGTASQMAFVDAAASNFHLTSGSPARNAGSQEFPETDFDEVARPQEGAPDQGAFEYHGEDASSPPLAPDNLAVQ
jgi:hypothetical protein